MEYVLDSVRRMVKRWVSTATPITAGVSTGDTDITVRSSIRFREGEEVMLRDPLRYETGLIIDEIVDNNTVRLTSSVLNNWTVSQNTVLEKTINQMFVQGIYIGEPEVIPMYPAITVNGLDRNSEWLTLDSTKERYNIQITTYVLDSTQESGYRFLLKLTDIIQKGLKKNIFPLVGSYDVLSITADVVFEDEYIKVSSTSDLPDRGRLIIEDQYQSQETWLQEVVDETTIRINQGACYNFDKDDATIIIPNRFIFNSWPASVDFGKIHKGDLLKASTISWFAEEEEMQLMRKQDPHLS